MTLVGLTGGIDLVAREAGTGDLVAIQCKFYSPSATLSWGHVSTFIAMLGRAEFGSGLIVSTAGSESPNLYKNLDLHPSKCTCCGFRTSRNPASTGTSSASTVRVPSTARSRDASNFADTAVPTPAT